MRKCQRCRVVSPTHTLINSKCAACVVHSEQRTGKSCRKCGLRLADDRFPLTYTGRRSERCADCHQLRNCKECRRAVPVAEMGRSTNGNPSGICNVCTAANAERIKVRDLQHRRRDSYAEAMRKGRYPQGTTFEQWAGIQCPGGMARSCDDGTRTVLVRGWGKWPGMSDSMFDERKRHASRVSWNYRYRNDPQFALKERMRASLRKHRRFGCINTRLREGLSRPSGGRVAELLELLGYGIEDLRQHLERQFTSGMTWDAFCSGEIHIDHVVPIATFDLNEESEVRRCWSLPNLQPLWALDNLRKGAKHVRLL